MLPPVGQARRLRQTNNLRLSGLNRRCGHQFLLGRQFIDTATAELFLEPADADP
jgi:hypothetical protein